MVGEKAVQIENKMYAESGLEFGMFEKLDTKPYS